MVRKMQDMKAYDEKPHGGDLANGYHVTEWLTPEDIPGHGRGIKKVVLLKGSTYFDYHKTNGEFEVVYVLDGELSVADESDEGGYKTLHAGDFAISEGDYYIEAENESDKDATVMLGFFDHITECEGMGSEARKEETNELLSCCYIGDTYHLRRNPKEKVQVIHLSVDADNIESMITYQEIFGEKNKYITSLIDFEMQYEEEG